MRSILSAIFMLATASIAVDGYPMILEIAEESERCIDYNFPQDEDAHVVFLSVPSAAVETEDVWIQKQKKLETFYLGKMLELTKFRVHTTLPRKFPGDYPDDVMKVQEEFVAEYGGELKSGATVKITNPVSYGSRTMDTYWFTPVVINHIRRAVKSQQGAPPLEGYEICFKNTNEDYPVMMMMEAVTTAQGAEEDEDAGETFDGSHLTPLAEQLEESIAAAKTVVREMGYMESREQRMRKTADSINARVRYFSYISVCVLLVVTYLQVTYLKRYFRKKKLL
eukprot:CAMPEP_0117039142 /NCGR_PEP_ID=MMETSP0472-20121206/27501_1 /TAXON_ID=693140 ORGANISM="Tiarina fusus, Strain LIS" /NCGR_SAMPLE_ID=MMETSP0472 /ASSEMBLY_ACC=CAM_ASM_000603 /LENGTH=280 /DNA_ID=CAMNT_0004749573 /DNA_START=146 /DNA_END=988 /DNA_ORIENTATION=+